MEGWFSRAPSDDQQQKPASSSSSTPSLLADWNSYASSTSQDTSNSGIAFDLESAVRSANNTVTGTFNVFFSPKLSHSFLLPLMASQLESYNSIGNKNGLPTTHPIGANNVNNNGNKEAGNKRHNTNGSEGNECKLIANEARSLHYHRVSKGVRDIPGNFQSATSSLPSGKALVYFALLLASGVFFIFIAFTLFLPVIVVLPQKFAICFTLGCGFIIGSFFALKGPKNQLAHMMSAERLPFTVGFICSMIGTIYVSMVRHSYILSVLFSVVQVLSLGYYSISYFPGGSAGMRFLTSSITSRIMNCFGR